jgi:apolipoprotein N-acyltransferase
VQLLSRLVLAVLGGFALSAAFEPHAWPALAVPGVALFALATAGLGVRAAGLTGLTFGAVFYFTHIFWMRESIGLDAWLALSAAETLFYGLLGAVTPLVRTLPGWPVWLAATWTSMELLRSTWPFSGMPWGRVSFAAIDTPVAGAAAYVGLAGLSFLLVLASFLLAALVETWWRAGRPEGWRASRGRRLLLATALVAVLGALVLPVVRPFEVEESGSAVVAVVQGDVPGPGNDILYDHRGVTRNHAEATEELAADVAAGRRPQPDFVLWPENSTAVDPFADNLVNDDIEEAVAAVGVPVLVGALVDDGEDHILNQGIVWDPVSGPGDRYTKHHPVAYGEYIPYRDLWNPTFGRLAEITRDMKTGTGTEPLRVADLQVADAICFDVAYDEVMRDQVAEGADLITVQTSNVSFIFSDQIDQQFAITRLRAVETGRWLAVASPNGISGVVAPDGTVVASADPLTAEVMVERVTLSDTLTPAVRLGAWPARVFTGLSVLGLLIGVVSYRRSRDHAGSPQEDAAPGKPDGPDGPDEPDGAPPPAPTPTPSEAPVG